MKKSVLWCTFVLSGCTSISTYQTARVQPARSSRIVLGGGYTQVPTSNGVKIGFPILEGMFQYGLGSQFDVTGRYTFPGALGLGGKFQFLDHTAWAAAIGLDVNYLGLRGDVSSATTTSTNRFDVNILDAAVPLYLSVDVAEPFTVYISPKYLYRYFWGSANASTSSSSQSYAGSTFGFRLGGKRVGIFLEGTYLAALTATPDITQAGIAFYFGGALQETSSQDRTADPL